MFNFRQKLINSFRPKMNFVLAISLLCQSGWSQILELDVSGKPGQDAKNGTSHSGSASTGYDGSDGGHAGLAGKGQSAGSIRLNMQRRNIGLFVVNAMIFQPGNQKPESNYYELQVATKGNLVLKARGGRGGKGGVGGDGEGGGRGRDGDDATRYSTGTNGHTGGGGGDAGKGTSGELAGNGGEVIVELPEKDTALLMLIEEDVEAGEGGKKGKHGSPGSGGSGGRGGSSYSWTETTYTTETSTDSNGNTSSQQVPHSTTHSNSGGYDGSSGPSGRSQTTILEDGRNGEKGKYQIRVIDAKGATHTYSERYDLKLISYDIIPEDHDGILEAGEKVFLKNIVVQNTSSMPTPETTTIRLFLENSQFSVADSVEIKIPRSLKPGEKMQFSNEDLSFVIKNNILGKIGEERIVWSDSIKPIAQMTEVDRNFNGFSESRQIQITFPVEIETVTAARSLAPGEKSKILMRIKNISGKDFGTESQLKRQLELFLKQNTGDLKTSNYVVTGADGQVWDMTKGIVQAISNLKAGETVMLEGQIELNADAEPYRGVDLGFRLDIGTPRGAAQKSSVQERVVGFRVSQTYKNDPSSDVLLVVNNETDHATIENFKAHAARLGIKFNIWDLSYYGKMALTELLNHGANLADDFKGKTLVVLNNEFASNRGEITPFSLISTLELIAAAQGRNINTLIVSGKQEGMFDGIDLLDFSDKESKIEIHKWTWFSKPPPSQYLSGKAHRMLGSILSSPTLDQYQVVTTYKPELIRKGFLGIGRLWNLGTLKVIQSLSAHAGQVVTVNTSQNANFSAADINSRSFHLSLALAMPFERRVELLNKWLSDAKGAVASQETLAQARIFAESILINLASEQTVARRLSVFLGFSKRSLRERLPLLNRLNDLAVKLDASLANTQEQREVWMELINGLTELVKAQSRWWEYLIPLKANPEISRVSRGIIENIQAKIFKRAPWFRSTRADEFKRKEVKALKEKAAPLKIDQKLPVTVINNEIKSKVVTANTENHQKGKLDREEQTTDKLNEQLRTDANQLKGIGTPAAKTSANPTSLGSNAAVGPSVGRSCRSILSGH